jgi:hypothetical protein
MDPLREIVKAHIRAARRFYELGVLERMGGMSDSAAKQRAELVTTCQFYDEVKRILEEIECDS